MVLRPVHSPAIVWPSVLIQRYYSEHSIPLHHRGVLKLFLVQRTPLISPPIPKTFNHGLLRFAGADETQRDGIVEALKAAEDRFVENFPWLGGAVVNEGSGPGNSGLYKLVPWPATASAPNSIVRDKDASDVVASWVDLTKSSRADLDARRQRSLPLPALSGAVRGHTREPGAHHHHPGHLHGHRRTAAFVLRWNCEFVSE